MSIYLNIGLQRTVSPSAVMTLLPTSSVHCY